MNGFPRYVFIATRRFPVRYGRDALFRVTFRNIPTISLTRLPHGTHTHEISTLNRYTMLYTAVFASYSKSTASTYQTYPRTRRNYISDVQELYIK